MNNETNSPSLLPLLCKEPYRLLFPVGILWALFGSSHWLAFHFRLTTDYGPLYHGLVQIIGFGGCLAAGFLMTALPNFLGTRPAAPWELLLALLFGLAGGTALLLNHIRLGVLSFLLLMVLLDVFTLRRYLKRQGEPPPFAYIVWGLALGTVGPLLVLFPCPGLPRVGVLMLEQGFLLALVMGIGSFLGARFIGTFQPPAFLFRMAPGQPPVPPFVKMKRLFFVGGLLFFASFWLEGILPMAGKLLRAAVVTAQFCVFGRIYRRPTQPFLTARLLWLSFWLLIAGLWLGALLPRYEIHALHVAYIGGLGLMMLVMGFRVVVSHGGVGHLWERVRVPLWIIGTCVGLAILLRVGAVFVPKLYTHHLAGAAALWNVALVVWAFIALPYLTPSHREK